MTKATRRSLALGVIVAALAASVIGAAAATGANGNRLDLSVCAPPPANTFSLTISNTYFPLTVGDRWVFTGKEQGEPLGLLIEVLPETEDIYNGRRTVETRVVRETEWVDADRDGVIGDPAEEPLIESSLNYFAQADDGTVCYFGEAVDIYENGEVVSHEGSWRADEPQSAPGIFMPANPEVGMTFQQEVSPVAQDEATILAFRSVTVPAGSFESAMKVRDFNPLDGSRGVKWYAPNEGLVVDGPLDRIS